MLLNLWLELVSSEDPRLLDFGSPPLQFIIGWVFAAGAIVITLILTSIWSARYILLYLVLATGTILAAAHLSTYISDSTLDTAVQTGTVAVAATLALIASAVAFADSVSQPLSDQLQLRMPPRWVIISFIAPFVAAIALAFLWPYTPLNPLEHPEAPDYVAEIHSSLGGSLAATLIYIAVLVPIGEEILFRGLVASFLRESTNTFFAIILSAMIFALFHIDISYFSFNQVVYVFCMGMMLAATMFATRSIWPGIFLHGINNAIVIMSAVG